MNVFAKNTTSASITVAGHKVYYIDSTDAEIVEVEGTSLSLYLNPWKSAESVTDTGMFGAGYTLYLGDGSVYNEGNIPGFIAAYNGDTSISDFENRLELIIRNGKVVLDGVGSYATWVSRIEVSNPVKYNAFKYTLSGTPYYYVIDGEHDTWTDDLSAWGYSEVPVGPVLPEVSDTGILLSNGNRTARDFAQISNSNYADMSVSNNSNAQLYERFEYGRVYFKAEDGFIYSLGNYGKYDGTWLASYGSFTLSISNNEARALYITNVSGGAISLSYIKCYSCSDSTATVITVYNSSNVAYNAFKFTANNTDYYYVLDGTQADWTDDLAGIGYHLAETAWVTDNQNVANVGSGTYGCYLYDSSGVRIGYDSGKTYTLVAYYESESGTKQPIPSTLTLTHSTYNGTERLWIYNYPGQIPIQRVEYTVS